MGQVLHGRATTTEAVRRALQLRRESVRAAARRYGVSPTTVQKWRKRRTVADERMADGTQAGPLDGALDRGGSRGRRAFRRHTRRCRSTTASTPSSPPSRTSRDHRSTAAASGATASLACPTLTATSPDGDKPERSRFKAYPIGYFHIDIAEVHTEEGRLHLFVAVDRTSKFAFAQLHERATRRIAADFLRALAAAVP